MRLINFCQNMLQMSTFRKLSMKRHFDQSIVQYTAQNTQIKFNNNVNFWCFKFVAFIAYISHFFHSTLSFYKNQ